MNLDLKDLHIGFIAIIVLSVVGYALAPNFAAPAVATELSPAYTLDTPIAEIAATPAGEALLKKNIPGLLEHSSYPMFKSLSLRVVGNLSGGRLTAQTLARTELDLAALPPPATPTTKVAQFSDPEFD